MHLITPGTLISFEIINLFFPDDLNKYCLSNIIIKSKVLSEIRKLTEPS